MSLETAINLYTCTSMTMHEAAAKGGVKRVVLSSAIRKLNIPDKRGRKPGVGVVGDDQRVKDLRQRHQNEIEALRAQHRAELDPLLEVVRDDMAKAEINATAREIGALEARMNELRALHK